MNTFRMRKRVARTVPDRVTREFDPFTIPEWEFKLQESNWEYWFVNEMRLKHGKKFDCVRVIQDSLGATMPGTVVLILEVVLKS